MPSLLRYRIGEKASLELVQGNIVEETTDAIVNAANSSLLGGGGVDGAIHRAAGPELLAECRKIRDQRGTLPSGQVASTKGGKLKVRHVIHTVGPVWQGGKRNEPQVLESCYCNSLEEAIRLGCSSVSFPSISTGAFGYPVQQAATIALRTVVDHLHSPRSLELVRFVLFDGDTYQAYQDAAQKLVPAFPHFRIEGEITP
ncbi:MAG TPA: O-acetyl-ADP-ribose deacetylase [Candidatus Angelobacter sp.]|nr:O-acetyl-ADP-ribose deacetylase [Candidatus Angelobacter sp.]